MVVSDSGVVDRADHGSIANHGPITNHRIVVVVAAIISRGIAPVVSRRVAVVVDRSIAAVIGGGIAAIVPRPIITVTRTISIRAGRDPADHRSRDESAGQPWKKSASGFRG